LITIILFHTFSTEFVTFVGFVTFMYKNQGRQTQICKWAYILWFPCDVFVCSFTYVFIYYFLSIY